MASEHPQKRQKATSDEHVESVVTAVERERSGGGLLGQIRDEGTGETKTQAQLTAVSWVLAAGAYGYIAGTFGGDYPEYGWAFLLLGVGIGSGFAGLLALTGGEDDGE